MKIMFLLIILFLATCIVAFASGFFFGPVAASFALLLGLSLSFIKIAFVIGRQ